MGVAEAAGERARCEVRAGGELVDADRPGEVGLGPGDDVGERVTALATHIDVNELGLAAVAVRRNDETAGDLVGDVGAVVAPDEVQAEVDACGASGRCEHGAVVDVEDVGVDVDERERPARGDR